MTDTQTLLKLKCLLVCVRVLESLNDLLSEGVCVQGNEPHDSFSDVRYYNCL